MHPWTRLEGRDLGWRRGGFGPRRSSSTPCRARPTPSWEIFWSLVYYWIYHSFFFQGHSSHELCRSCWRKWRAPSGWNDESRGIDGEGVEKTTWRSVRSEHVSIEISSDSYLYEPFGFFIIYDWGLGTVEKSWFPCCRELYRYECSNNPLPISHLLVFRSKMNIWCSISPHSRPSYVSIIRGNMCQQHQKYQADSPSSHI